MLFIATCHLRIPELDEKYTRRAVLRGDATNDDSRSCADPLNNVFVHRKCQDAQAKQPTLCQLTLRQKCWMIRIKLMEAHCRVFWNRLLRSPSRESCDNKDLVVPMEKTSTDIRVHGSWERKFEKGMLEILEQYKDVFACQRTNKETHIYHCTYRKKNKIEHDVEEAGGQSRSGGSLSQLCEEQKNCGRKQVFVHQTQFIQQNF